MYNAKALLRCQFDIAACLTPRSRGAIQPNTTYK
jgi:hypothetical protein